MRGYSQYIDKNLLYTDSRIDNVTIMIHAQYTFNRRQTVVLLVPGVLKYNERVILGELQPSEQPRPELVFTGGLIH